MNPFEPVDRIGTATGLALAGALIAVPFVFSDVVVYQFAVTLTYAMAVIGINLTLGFAGVVSLAQSAFFAAGAYTTAVLMSRYGISYLPAIAFGGLAAAVLGVAVGLPALRLQGLQLAILTFSLAALVPQLILKFPATTQGVAGISLDKPASPAWFPGGQDQWLYVLCLIAFALFAIGMRRVLRGSSGRALVSLRDGPLIATSFGVNATSVHLSVFLLGSFAAGVGGGLFAVVNAYISPDSFMASRSIEFVIASVVGGLTSVTGSLLGAAFIVFVPEWASKLNAAIGHLTYGIALLLVVLLAPGGMVGAMRKGVMAAKGWLQRRPRSAPPRDQPTAGMAPSGESVATRLVVSSSNFHK